MSSIDEISHTLGKIEANQEESLRQNKKLFENMDAMSKENSETRGIANAALQISTELKSDINKSVKPKIKKFQRLVWMASGMLMLLSGAASAYAYAVSNGLL